MTTRYRRPKAVQPITIRIDHPRARLDPVVRDSLYLFRYVVGDDRAASGDKALKALTRLSKKALLSHT